MAEEQKKFDNKSNSNSIKDQVYSSLNGRGAVSEIVTGVTSKSRAQASRTNTMLASVK